jgi:hypothetical protein
VSVPHLPRTVAIARVVAEHWRDAFLHGPARHMPMECRFAAHPLALVLAALAGEEDPVQLGVEPGSPAAARIQALRDAS